MTTMNPLMFAAGAPQEVPPESEPEPMEQGLANVPADTHEMHVTSGPAMERRDTVVPALMLVENVAAPRLARIDTMPGQTDMSHFEALMDAPAYDQRPAVTTAQTNEFSTDDFFSDSDGSGLDYARFRPEEHYADAVDLMTSNQAKEARIAQAQDGVSEAHRYAANGAAAERFFTNDMRITPPQAVQVPVQYQEGQALSTLPYGAHDRVEAGQANPVETNPNVSVVDAMYRDTVAENEQAQQPAAAPELSDWQIEQQRMADAARDAIYGLAA